MRIVVSGLIAQYPLGGVTWDYIQYVLGLVHLGHDVYYVEDTGVWPFNPLEGGTASDHKYNVEYLHTVMSRFGLGDNWAYRFPWKSQWFGMSDTKRDDILRSADLIINVSGVLQRPWEYQNGPRLVYIDSDPVFTQVKLARGQSEFAKMVDAHDVHFSFGESFSTDVPETGHKWIPTRQPIVLSEWNPMPEIRAEFTTIMNWTSYKALSHEGKEYGQKDREFRHFMDLPGDVAPVKLELAVNSGKTTRTPRRLLAKKGWKVVNPDEVCPDLDSYRSYIGSSKAEWSVAKHGYVVGQSGWFSCRSACYLASGRPVVVQETGFSKILDISEGILPFSTYDEAVNAIESVVEHYNRHSEAARGMAETYFDSDRVLADLLESSMSTS